MRTCGQEFTDEILEWIRAVVSGDASMSRTRLSRLVCERMSWRMSDGRPKTASCWIALQRLAKRGRIILPEARRNTFSKTGVSALEISAGDTDVKEAKAGGGEPLLAKPFRGALEGLGRVRLELVAHGDNVRSRLWKSMMGRHHYLRDGPLCGGKLLYFIESEKVGIVGGLSFSSSAWRLKDRDKFIQWGDAAREAHLQEVVCNSRFLILPWIEVGNLASHALSLIPGAMPDDWRERYGVEPAMLETFVDPARFKGTCYLAGGWKETGETAGRGRCDRDNLYEAGVKKIFLLVLDGKRVKEWGVRLPRPVEPVYYKTVVEDGGAASDWTATEFGAANLKDERLGKRLRTIAADFYAKLSSNIPEACGGVNAKAKAVYRFFQSKRFNMNDILAPHVESTIGRCAAAEGVVLAVQDTTTLNYTAHQSTKDLGPIGKKGGSVGLHLHSTIAFDADGVPLGLLHAQCWARDKDGDTPSAFSSSFDTSKTESEKWQNSFKALIEMKKRLPRVPLISVGDREADFYELFELALSSPDNPHLLVRAHHNRALEDEQGKLWEFMGGHPAADTLDVQIPPRGGRKARTAQVVLRFAQVTLKPPQNMKDRKALKIWAVLAREDDPPDGTDALEWMLLTTAPTVTAADAAERLQWYCRRWGIEVFHRILKSGCRIEDRQLGDADTTAKCLAVDMVAAWRVFHMTILGRYCPNEPCTIFFTESQWKALSLKHTGTIPDEPPTLKVAMRQVAALGGFLGRKSDGDPGPTTLWRGFEKLDGMAEIFEITMNYRDELQKRPPSYISSA